MNARVKRTVAAALLWSALAAIAAAQAPGAPAGSGASQTDGSASDRADRDDDRVQEPQTVQQQMQTVKREVRGQKFDLSKAAPVRDADRQFQLRVPSYVQIRQRNIVMQQRDYSCGAACVATILRYYWGDDVTEDMVLDALDEILTPEEIADRIENGLAMSDLRRAAVKMGYQAVVGKTTFMKLTEAKIPMVVGIQPSGHKHFVVYRGTDLDWVYMADPIRGNVRMPVWEFVKQWQENAVLVIHKPGQKVKSGSPLNLQEGETHLSDLQHYIIQTQQNRQPQNAPKIRP